MCRGKFHLPIENIFRPKRLEFLSNNVKRSRTLIRIFVLSIPNISRTLFDYPIFFDDPGTSKIILFLAYTTILTPMQSEHEDTIHNISNYKCQCSVAILTTSIPLTKNASTLTLGERINYTGIVISGYADCKRRRDVGNGVFYITVNLCCECVLWYIWIRWTMLVVSFPLPGMELLLPKSSWYVTGGLGASRITSFLRRTCSSRCPTWPGQTQISGRCARRRVYETKTLRLPESI